MPEAIIREDVQPTLMDKVNKEVISDIGEKQTLTPDTNPDINSDSQPEDIIFDPFMGSGTTLMAAKELGRHAIGCDLSKKYCNVTIERLKQESLFSVVGTDNNANAGELRDAPQFQHCASGQVLSLF